MKRIVIATLAMLALIAALSLPSFNALGLTATPASQNSVTFTFEAAGTGPDLVYGSHDPQGFSALVRDGFIIDVIPTGSINGELHWHETDSISNAKVPDRPAEQRGVLCRDSDAGQDPLVFVREIPNSTFTLESLVAGASFADGSATNAVRVSGFLAGNLIGTADLPVSNSYVSYSGSALGGLQGLRVDRLEFVGLASSAISYYMLYDIVLETSFGCPGAVSVNHHVGGLLRPLQQGENTCWATAGTIMYSWRNRRPSTEEQVVALLDVPPPPGFSYLDLYRQSKGLGQMQWSGLTARLGIQQKFFGFPQPCELEAALKFSGPILVVTSNEGYPPSPHAQVIVGIQGDGSDAGTFVFLIDPADGHRNRISYANLRFLIVNVPTLWDQWLQYK